MADLDAQVDQKLTMSEQSAAATKTSTSASASSSSSSSPSGIPQAPFIDDVVSHLGGPDVDVAPTLQKFQEAMSKYKMMESTTFQRFKSLEEKIPDISKTLQMVEYLKLLKEKDEVLKTQFELHYSMFTAAEIEPVEEVNLWLGANVMLSYPLDEAIELLRGKLTAAEKSIETTKRDLDFLRDQITTMEVNTARVHNWDVKRRREQRLKQGGGQSD